MYFELCYDYFTFATSHNWFVCLNETENKFIGKVQCSDSMTKTGYIPLFSPGKNTEPCTTLHSQSDLGEYSEYPQTSLYLQAPCLVIQSVSVKFRSCTLTRRFCPKPFSTAMEHILSGSTQLHNLGRFSHILCSWVHFSGFVYGL